MKDGRTDRQTDRQTETDESDFIGCCPTDIERPISFAAISNKILMTDVNNK